jgi:hypothetical protein
MEGSEGVEEISAIPCKGRGEERGHCMRKIPARLIDIRWDSEASGRFLNVLQMYCIDGYDAPLLDAMTRRGPLNVITDDGDFATVPDIRVFTANAHVIALARRQGKLLTRG